MENTAKKVLLVDDEADFRQLLRYWLASKGYSVVTAENGAQAVTLARDERPDIILLDLNMPVLDGAAALKQIRSFDKEVPVIIISAYVDDRRAKEAMREGISGVLYKGTDFQDGLSMLEVVLHTHKQLKK